MRAVGPVKKTAARDLGLGAWAVALRLPGESAAIDLLLSREGIVEVWAQGDSLTHTQIQRVSAAIRAACPGTNPVAASGTLHALDATRWTRLQAAVAAERLRDRSFPGPRGQEYALRPLAGDASASQRRLVQGSAEELPFANDAGSTIACKNAYAVMTTIGHATLSFLRSQLPLSNASSIHSAVSTNTAHSNTASHHASTVP